MILFSRKSLLATSRGSEGAGGDQLRDLAVSVRGSRLPTRLMLTLA